VWVVVVAAAVASMKTRDLIRQDRSSYGRSQATLCRGDGRHERWCSGGDMEQHSVG
jgi:hypothetical protein